jgi:uncharacterized protein YbjT (DUF2867 family)
MKKILITGATGATGGNAIQEASGTKGASESFGP